MSIGRSVSNEVSEEAEDVDDLGPDSEEVEVLWVVIAEGLSGVLVLVKVWEGVYALSLLSFVFQIGFPFQAFEWGGEGEEEDEATLFFCFNKTTRMKNRTRNTRATAMRTPVIIPA